MQARSLFAVAFLMLSCSSVEGAQVRGAPVPLRAQSSMSDLVLRFDADRGALRRFWSVDSSPRREERLRRFCADVQRELDALDFDALDLEGKIDWVLLRNEVAGDVAELDLVAARRNSSRELVPYFTRLLDLVEVTQRIEALDPAHAAAEVVAIEREVTLARKSAMERKAEWSRSTAFGAASMVDELAAASGAWFRSRDGYDPEFSWWLEKPFAALEKTLVGHAKALREDIAGVPAGDETIIVGQPIGRDALVAELAGAMIAYSPEELLRIADLEFAWCEREMLAAAREMGFGDDWRAALEKVKTGFVPPGEQTALVRELADEAVRFIEERDLLTIPELAKESWRMRMLSPREQLVSPFFLGGEVIQVAYPTDDMEHDKKLMSMRGNNRHFARATVHHELIPGHHLQQFMTARHQVHRRTFATPFWTEGWALWWEMLLWDSGFASRPEDKIGMLFWRSHRCARIRFSLSFHLGEWTPEQCIDFLVERVGHERENAAAEVRRSFNGSYGPLYQIAYMLGALQLRELHREVVLAGSMAPRAFHDAILKGGNMPIEMVRARLSGTAPMRDFRAAWRFYPLAQ